MGILPSLQLYLQHDMMHLTSRSMGQPTGRLLWELVVPVEQTWHHRGPLIVLIEKLKARASLMLPIGRHYFSTNISITAMQKVPRKT